ncbi:MAG: DUF1559 domain-containing protein [Gemmataceae bacterium]
MHRRAFTLLELLVAIALIGVLIGLLLPAVQRVRDAAYRTHCVNNLKQLGLALHQHHDARGSLPQGMTSNQRGEPYPRSTWLTRLLPYVEQDALWRTTVDAYRQTRRSTRNPPHVGFTTVVSTFVCPSDDRAGVVQATHRDYRVALTSYLGVLGTAWTRTDGILYLDSRVKLIEITDGTATTLAVGERPPSADFWYGWWYTGFGQVGTGSGDSLLGVRERSRGDTYTWFCPEGPYAFGPGRADEQCDMFHFWSQHVGGAHFLFCDGSVRLLQYSADPLLPTLATRAGGEAAVLPD